MRFIYTNEIDSLEATALTALSETSGFEVTYVQDERLGTKWQTSTATVQTCVIEFAATTTANITTAAILGHNFLTTTTVLIEGNSADSWGAPALTTTMTVIDTDKAVLYFFASAQNYKWWRFSFSGQASLEIGRLWLGSYVTVTPSSLKDFSVIKKRSDNVSYGRGRQKYASTGIGWREFQLLFPPTKTTTLNIIQTMYDTVGNHSSLIFCNFDTDRTYAIVEPCYCSIVGEVDFKHEDNMKFSYSITLEEDK